MSHFQRKHYEYSYVASLAMVFLVYTLSQELNGSGPISALIFGIIISNGEEIFRALKYRHSISFNLNKESKSFNNLVTFFTTSFFFVYFGAMITLQDYPSFVVGLVIALVILLARFSGTYISLFKSKYSGTDKIIVSSMMSRGIGTAIVATIPIAYSIKNTSNLVDVVFSVIFFTVFFNSVLVELARKRQVSIAKTAGV